MNPIRPREAEAAARGYSQRGDDAVKVVRQIDGVTHLCTMTLTHQCANQTETVEPQ